MKIINPLSLSIILYALYILYNKYLIQFSATFQRSVKYL